MNRSAHQNFKHLPRTIHNAMQFPRAAELSLEFLDEGLEIEATYWPRTIGVGIIFIFGA